MVINFYFSAKGAAKGAVLRIRENGSLVSARARAPRCFRRRRREKRKRRSATAKEKMSYDVTGTDVRRDHLFRPDYAISRTIRLQRGERSYQPDRTNAENDDYRSDGPCSLIAHKCRP